MTRRLQQAILFIFYIASFSSAILADSKFYSTEGSMIRCLSSEPGPFTKVDFKKDLLAGQIAMQVTVVLGYSDRWLHMNAQGTKVTPPERSSWNLYKITASPVEGEELNWFGIITDCP